MPLDNKTLTETTLAQIYVAKWRGTRPQWVKTRLYEDFGENEPRGTGITLYVPTLPMAYLTSLWCSYNSGMSLLSCQPRISSTTASGVTTPMPLWAWGQELKHYKVCLHFTITIKFRVFRDRRVIPKFKIYLYLFYDFHTKGQNKIITAREIIVRVGKLLDGL